MTGACLQRPPPLLLCHPQMVCFSSKWAYYNGALFFFIDEGPVPSAASTLGASAGVFCVRSYNVCHLCRSLQSFFSDGPPMIACQRLRPHVLRSFRRQLRFASSDDYRVLGLAKGCTAQQVNAAFQRRAKQTHPDHNTAPNAQEEFLRVFEAREALLVECAPAPAAASPQRTAGYSGGATQDSPGAAAGSRPKSPPKSRPKGRRASAAPWAPTEAKLRRKKRPATKAEPKASTAAHEGEPKAGPGAAWAKRGRSEAARRNEQTAEYEAAQAQERKARAQLINDLGDEGGPVLNAFDILMSSRLFAWLYVCSRGFRAVVWYHLVVQSGWVKRIMRAPRSSRLRLVLIWIWFFAGAMLRRHVFKICALVCFGLAVGQCVPEKGEEDGHPPPHQTPPPPGER